MRSLVLAEPGVYSTLPIGGGRTVQADAIRFSRRHGRTCLASMIVGFTMPIAWPTAVGWMIARISGAVD
jgi:hypothetical protein